MNELRIEGTQEFMGMDIPVVYGGFGPNQKVILAKTIGEIHGVTTPDINKLINRNVNRFTQTDIIDLKNCQSFNDQQLLELGFTNMQISKANNIYLLSERGYAKVIKIMDTDKAWEVHDKFIDEYFAMRQVISSNENMKAQLLLAMYNGGAYTLTRLILAHIRVLFILLLGY